MACEVSKLLNGLLDPLASRRLAALQHIHRWLSSRRQSALQAASARADAQGFPDMIDEVVCKPLLRRFADPSEKCRCLSIRIFSEILEFSPQSIAPLLPYIFPVISERFPLESIHQNSTNLNVEEVQYKARTLEESEEVRLLLVQLVHQLLKQGRRLIGPFSSDIASILMSAASDNDPSVLVEVFATLRFFAELVGENLKSISKTLVSATLHALHHKRCRVRVAALQAIERLVLCGGHSSIYDLTAYRDPNIIPIRDFYHSSVKTQYLALLASDRSLMVREALLRAVACWLLELQERREHEVRLLPYVLNGFRDENKEIQELAFDLMECIGRQYEKENEDEVKDKKQYLPEDIESSKNYTDIAPFLKRRPCLGARIMVRRSFGILFHALSADLQAWQEQPKVLAAELLYILIVFIEDDATMHLQAMLTAMIKTGSNVLIEKKIEECARALGCFVDPFSYLEILVPRITGEFNPDASMVETGQALRLLSWMMMGTPAVLLTRHIPEICSMLTHQDLITSLQQEVHGSIVSVMEVVVAAFDETCSGEVVSVLWILLNAYATGEIRKKPCQERTDRVLEELCKRLGFQGKHDIVEAHLDDLTNLLELPQKWSSRSVDPIICVRLLEEASLSHSPVIPKLLNMLGEFASVHKGDVKHGCSWLMDRITQLQVDHT